MTSCTQALNDFELSLVENARKVRDERLSTGAQCCGTCKFSGPTAHPDHASHYLRCGWIDQFTLLPEYFDKWAIEGKLLTIGHSGMQCKAYVSQGEKP